MAMLEKNCVVSNCVVCSKPGKFKCGGCQTAGIYYCGPECQKSHWKNGHKAICKPSHMIVPVDYILIFGADKGNLEIVQDQLRTGADPNYVIRQSTDRRLPLVPNHLEGFFPLFAAVAGNGDSGDIVEALLAAGANVDQTLDDGTSSVSEAALRNRIGCVRVLIKAGANVNLADTAGIAPLYSVAQTANLQVATLLLAAGADPNQRSHKGNTPIMAAISTGHPDMLRLLMNSGAIKTAELPRRVPDQWTPLYIASLNNQVECVKILLQEGNVDVNKRVQPGDKTALVVAAVNGYLALGRILLDAGADATFVNATGTTALSAAIECGQPAFAAMLRAHIAMRP